MMTSSTTPDALQKAQSLAAARAGPRGPQSPSSRSPTTVNSPAEARQTPAGPEDHRDDSGTWLISSVRGKQADVKRYLRAVNARRRRLVTVTIVAAAIATLLTAPVALGGKPLANWLTETFELSSPSWRILCALAAVCSLIAAVATQLHASKNYEEHIGRAQEIRAALEMLEVAITLNHLNQHEATSQYLDIIESTSFIDAAR
jgi:hypothetical protein